MLDVIRLNQFPSVAASAVSTLVTDQLRGRSLHGLLFKRGGGAFTNAHVNNVRVRLDGKDVVNNITGAQLVDLNEYDGLTDVTNYTALFFGDPTARTIRGQHLGDVDLSVYPAPLEIEVSIGAATTPTLEVLAITGPRKAAMPANFNALEQATMRALIRTVIQPSAAVSRKTYGVSLGSSAGARIRRLAFFHTNLTSVEYKKQGFIKLDDVTSAEASALQQQFARVPQAGLYVMDAVLDGNQGEADMTVRDDGTPWNLELAVTTSAGDTIYAFSDLFLTLPQL